MSGSDPILFEAKEVVDSLLDAVDVIMANEEEDSVTYMLPPAEKDKDKLSGIQDPLVSFQGDDEKDRNENDGYEVLEDENEDRSRSSQERSSDREVSADEMLIALLSLANVEDLEADVSPEAVADLEDVDRIIIDIVRWGNPRVDAEEIVEEINRLYNAANEDSESDPDSDNAANEDISGRLDNALNENIVDLDNAPEEEIVGDFADEGDRDLDDEDEIDLNVRRILIEFFEEDDEEEEGSGDHPPEGAI